jgi:hypothetical protein
MGAEAQFTLRSLHLLCDEGAEKNMAGEVLFSGFPPELAQFYNDVRRLNYNDAPHYHRWEGIFHSLLDPYVQTHGSFESASARSFEIKDWPIGLDSWPIPDEGGHDDDEADCMSVDIGSDRSFLCKLARTIRCQGRRSVWGRK